MQKVHYTQCPVCASADIHPLLTVKDYTVSQEEFVIWQCSACTLRFTQDVPDAESIGPYYKSENYISHTNTSKGLVNALYQKVRTHTLQQKTTLIKESTGLENGKLLDMGCGTGAFLNAIKAAGWQVTGIEPDSDARQVATQLYGITPLETDVFYELTPASFDAITLWHVLEHVHDLHRYMEQLKALLKPSGKLFIAVPNYTSADAETYRLKWAAYDVPRHLYHFNPKSIQVLAQKHGLDVRAKKPMWFDSFYISMLSSKYKNGSTNWIGAPLVGLRSNLKALLNTDYCSSLIYIIEK
ncbi:MAG: class SAM-dependent methyltransferase [Flaviaesturariibacter sp.]|nr:class SAM-dependent methyltransferase [Flaviaesturariibacter sp.]